MEKPDLAVWRVLHIDDDEDDYLLTREMLRQARGRKIVLDWAPTYKEGKERLLENHYDAVLVDYDLGAQTGIKLIQEVTYEGYRAPIILYTGRGNYEVDIEAMQSGATLYLTKAEVNPLLLERSIRYAIELKRSEQERTHILESIQDGLFALDKDWRFIFINRRAAEISGHEPEQLIGLNIWETYPKLLGSPAEHNYRQVMKERKWVKFEMEGVYRGTWYDINVYPFQEGISVYWQDITERKKAEEALRERECEQREMAKSLELDRARLTAILENLPVGVWIADQKGQLIQKNERADRIWAGDAPLSDSIDKYQEYTAWFPDSGKLLQPDEYPVAQALKTQQPVEPVELNILRFDGTQGTVLVSAVPVINREGLLTGVVGVNVDITDRKETEENLRLSEERFSKAFNATPSALVISRLGDGQIEMINNSFERLFGYSRAEVIGKTSLQLNMFANPADRERIVQQMSADPSIRSFDVEIRHKTGETRQAHLSVEILTISSETHILTIIEDISERNQAEEARRMSEEAMDAFFETSPAILNLFDEQLRYIKTDPITPTYFDHDRQSLIGKSVFEVNPPFAEQFLEPMRRRVTETGEPELNLEVPGPVPSRQGEMGYWRVSYFPVPLPQGRTGLGVVGVDITDHKKAEEAMQASEIRIRQLADAMPQLVWTALPDGTVDYYNERYQEYHGILPASESRWEWSPVLHPEDVEATEEAWRRAVVTGDIYQIEHRVRMANGDYRWHLSRGVLARDEKGQAVKWFGTATDIHDLKEAEQALQTYTIELERSNLDLEEFAFVASHDLQEPLRKIEALADLFSEESDQLTERQADQLTRLRKSATRMRMMVVGLLQLSRLSTHAQPFQPVDLNELAHEILADLDLQIQRTGGMVEVGELPKIHADPLQMRQLLQNLIGNALKFQPPGGKPLVKVTAHENSQDTVQISVEDNGIGFNEEQISHLFQPFKRLVGRSEYEGSGIGLAICRKIAARHGGEISAISKTGQGSIFTVTLPIEQNNTTN